MALATAALVGGCGQNRQTEQSGQVEAPVETAAPAPTLDASTPAWVTQVRQGETELSQAVEQGRLGEVHDQAVKLGGVLKQVADQAGNLSPDQRQQLNEHLAAANRLVGEMHDAADAGDLTKSQGKLQEFRTHLRAIEGVFGVAAP